MAQNEFQAAYELSKQEQRSHIVDIPEGKFAVVCETPDYCKFTDATLPHPARRVVHVFATRAEAERAAHKLNRTVKPEDGEFSYAVKPDPPRAKYRQPKYEETPF